MHPLPLLFCQPVPAADLQPGLHPDGAFARPGAHRHRSRLLPGADPQPETVEISAAAHLQQQIAGRQSREYDKILITWMPEPAGAALGITMTMGAALIEVMRFTPDILRRTLKYSNPPQSAQGIFIVEFNALGNGGKHIAKILSGKPPAVLAREPSFEE